MRLSHGNGTSYGRRWIRGCIGGHLLDVRAEEIKVVLILNGKLYHISVFVSCDKKVGVSIYPLGEDSGMIRQYDFACPLMRTVGGRMDYEDIPRPALPEA
jgi:hypothetical protein